jgi:hypothetical protein
MPTFYRCFRLAIVNGMPRLVVSQIAYPLGGYPTVRGVVYLTPCGFRRTWLEAFC